MRIQQLVLENFRGFEKLEMDFPEGEGGLVVLVGVNGSGKTSVLDAIRKAFAQILIILNNDFDLEGGLNYPRYRIPDYVYNFNNHRKDIRIKSQHEGYRLTIGIKASNNDTVKYRYFFNGEKYSHLNYSERISLHHGFNNIVKNDSPIFINYSINRILKDENNFTPNVIEINKSANGQFFELMNNFLLSFEPGVDFRNLLTWFRDKEDYENELRLNQDPDFVDPELNILRKIIENFSLGYKNPRIKRLNYTRLIVTKDDTELDFNSLSHGERLYFAIASDICRRLIKNNLESENPLHGHGVVLIDEIELHLHPSWQRKIIPALRRTFPNVQFIVTTHSPQVISTVPKENVFILKDFQLYNAPHTKGRDSNTILEEIFFVDKTPKEFKEEIRKIYRIMEDPKMVKETGKMLNDIEEKYGFFHPEVIRARSFYDDLNNH